MTDIPEITGPELAPASGAAPTSLVVLLHGYGADGNDLIGLAPHYAQVLPDAHFMSPNAPLPCEMGFGYQWFSIQDQDPVSRLEQIRKGAAIIDRFIDAQLARFGLGDDRLALVGFSQGTMMSLFTGPRRAKPCAGIMGYSGRMESPELFGDEIVSRPPVVLVHGDSDELLSMEVFHTAVKTLEDADVPLESHVRPGLGHGIDEVGLQLGMKFLKDALGG